MLNDVISTAPPGKWTAEYAESASASVIGSPASSIGSSPSVSSESLPPSQAPTRSRIAIARTVTSGRERRTTPSRTRLPPLFRSRILGGQRPLLRDDLGPLRLLL